MVFGTRNLKYWVVGPSGVLMSDLRPLGGPPEQPQRDPEALQGPGGRDLGAEVVAISGPYFSLNEQYYFPYPRHPLIPKASYIEASGLKDLKQHGSGTLRPYCRGTWMFRALNEPYYLPYIGPSMLSGSGWFTIRTLNKRPELDRIWSYIGKIVGFIPREVHASF